MFIATGRDSLGLGRRLEASLPLPCLLHLAMHTIDAHCQRKLGKFVFSLHIHISPLKLRPYGAIYKNVYHHYYSCINILLLLCYVIIITFNYYYIGHVECTLCQIHYLFRFVPVTVSLAVQHWVTLSFAETKVSNISLRPKVLSET